MAPTTPSGSEDLPRHRAVQDDLLPDRSGSDFAPNPNWWGGKVLPAKLQHIFYDKQQPQILALSGGDVDIVNLIVPQGAEAVLNNPDYKLWVTKSSQHRELSMRNDKKPWNDKHVRDGDGAVAEPAGDRPGAVQGLRAARKRQPVCADLPLDRHRPCRSACRTSARPSSCCPTPATPTGSRPTCTPRIYQEIPDLRPDHQAGGGRRSASPSTCTSTDQSTYYGEATFGKSDWLDGAMSLVDYGHRGVPNVVPERAAEVGRSLERGPLQEPPVRQARQPVRGCTRSLHPAARLAGQIQTLLLEETPLILPYCFDAISVSKKTIGGVVTTGMGQIFLDGAGPSPPEAPRRAGGGPPAAGSISEDEMAVYILKRLGLALITLWILSMIVFLAGQQLPGRSRPGDPGKPRFAAGRRRSSTISWASTGRS